MHRPHEDGSEGLVELANEFSDELEQFHAIPPLVHPPSANFLSRWSSWIISQEVNKLLLLCKAYDKFVMSSYWTRLWIVQEIAKPKAV